MNDKRDQHAGATIDPQLSAHYVLLADEAVPPELDRMVLRSASSAVRTDGRQYRFMRWLRPAAFVATAGLSLALILDLSETGIVQPPGSSMPEVRQPPAIQPRHAPAPDDATRRRTAAGTASAVRREKSMATVSSKMAAPEATIAADGIATAMQEQGSGQCSDTQKAAVEAWWQCVVSLRRAGRSDLAESELESLQEEYPDFVTPD